MLEVVDVKIQQHHRAGTDASGIKCTAQPTEDGEHYVINGTKTWVVNGTNADHYLVFAAAAVCSFHMFFE